MLSKHDGQRSRTANAKGAGEEEPQSRGEGEEELLGQAARIPGRAQQQQDLCKTGDFVRVAATKAALGRKETKQEEQSSGRTKGGRLGRGEGEGEGGRGRGKKEGW